MRRDQLGEMSNLMKDGTETKPLYIKNFAKADWLILDQLRQMNNFATDAEAIRWAVRRAAGRV